MVSTTAWDLNTWQRWSFLSCPYPVENVFVQQVHWTMAFAVRTRLKFTEHSFAVSGPTAYGSSLPLEQKLAHFKLFWLTTAPPSNICYSKGKLILKKFWWRWWWWRASRVGRLPHVASRRVEREWVKSSCSSSSSGFIRTIWHTHMVYINEITKINQHSSKECLANHIRFKLKEKGL